MHVRRRGDRGVAEDLRDHAEFFTGLKEPRHSTRTEGERAFTANGLHSRRRLLTAAAGAVAAALTASVSTAHRVLAAGDDGSTIVIGNQSGDVRSTTVLAKATTTGAVLDIQNS